jgi:hypothetical protein
MSIKKYSRNSVQKKLLYVVFVSSVMFHLRRRFRFQKFGQARSLLCPIPVHKTEKS